MSAATRARNDGGWNVSLPDRTVITNIPLLDIIPMAYNIPPTLASKRVDFSHASRSVLPTRFDIQAKGVGDQRAMLRGLLADRFNDDAQMPTPN